MTDREKLIELLDAARDFADGECEKMVGCSCCPNDILAQHCQNPAIADHLLANGVVVREWIPVTERLPEQFVSVLGYMTDAGDFPPVRECYVVGKAFYFPALCDVHPVSHWMPLPEPPMRKGENG